MIKDGTANCGWGHVTMHMNKDGSVRLTPDCAWAVCASVSGIAAALASWLPGGKVMDGLWNFEFGATWCWLAGVEYDNGWFVVTSADRNALSDGKSVRLYPVY